MQSDELLDDNASGRLLGLVCHAATGRPNLHEPFFKDLLRFQKLQERQKKDHVSRAAIRMWRRGETRPRRNAALQFLGRYLIWAKGMQQASDWDAARLAAYDDAALTLSTLQPYPVEEKAAKSRPDASPAAALDPSLRVAMQTLLGISGSSPHSEQDAFFRGASHDAADDASYYLSYRYSTNHGAVVKSFVVVRKPVRDLRTTYVFNEFVGGGAGDRFIDHLYRESEGLIFRMERAFYFLGSNFNIPVDKKIDPEFYAVQRRRVRWQPNALTLNAFEYDDIRLDPGLFGGVTLNVADLSQPVVSRVAMLHLGVKSTLGRLLTDAMAQPGEMAAENVTADLQAIVEALREEGCRRFGHQIQRALASSTSGNDPFRRCGNQILRMIDNTPAWEAQLAAEGQRRRTAPTSRGALETFGAGRPRD